MLLHSPMCTQHKLNQLDTTAFKKKQWCLVTAHHGKSQKWMQIELTQISMQPQGYVSVSKVHSKVTLASLRRPSWRCACVADLLKQFAYKRQFETPTRKRRRL